MSDAKIINKRSLLNSFVLLFSYLLIALPLVYASSYLKTHFFSVVTVGFLLYAFIIDFSVKSYWKSSFIIITSLFLSYKIVDFSVFHYLIIFVHSLAVVFMHQSLKKREGERLTVNKTKLIFIFSIFGVGIITAIISKIILKIDCNEVFAWITGTLLSSIVIVPTILFFKNLEIKNLRILPTKQIINFITFVITIILLLALIMMSYNFHKYVFYISLIVIVFMMFYFTSSPSKMALPVILSVLSIGVVLFMLKHDEQSAPFPLIVASIELQALILFLFAHFLVIHNSEFIKKANLKQALIDNGYVNMFINLSATKLIIDAETGSIIDVNIAASKYYGYSIEELRKMNISDVSVYADKALEKVHQYDSSKGEIVETKHRLKSGEVRDVEVYPSDFSINGRQLKHAIVYDVTEKKRAEIALNLEKDRFQSLLGMVSNYTYSVFLKNGKISDIIYDDNCLSVTGYTSYELNSNVLLWEAIVYPDDLDILYHQHEIMQRGMSPEAIEYRIINKNGNLVWIRNSPLVKYDKQNDYYIYEGVVTDITEKKTLELSNYKSIIMAQEKEREYFSQELHDGIGPLISVAKLYTDLLTKSEDSAKTNEDSIINLQSLLGEISQSVRDLSNKLNPAILEKQGVVEALKQFISKVNQTNAIKINLESENWKLLDDFIKKNIYRIVTELINNTLKYADANEVNIILKNIDDIIEIEYRDDGVGFDINSVLEQPTGMGLSSIRNRLSALNGDLKMQSELGKGIQVKITINTLIKYK